METMLSLSSKPVRGPSLLARSPHYSPSKISSLPLPLSYFHGLSLQRFHNGIFRQTRCIPLCLTTFVCEFQGNATEMASGTEQLSPKDRRKLRNQRREVLKESKEPWREEVEEKLLVKQKKPKGWQEVLDVNRLATKGYQWWMLVVPRNAEKIAGEYITTHFPARFPGAKFEVFLPTVPAQKKLKDRRLSDARQRLYPGCLLVRLVLNREVYDFIRGVPRVRDFYGTKALTSVSDMIMPSAVSSVEMDEMFRRIEQEDALFEELKKAANIEAEERERQTGEAEANAELPTPPRLEEGAMVRVMSGPFINHTGIVTEMYPEEGLLKTTLTVFGKKLQLS